MSKLTHFDNLGNPKMVDVSEKDQTKRIADAIGYVHMKKSRYILSLREDRS